MQRLPADPGHQFGGGDGLDHAVGGPGLESAGDGLLPAASPRGVAAYIHNRLEKGARPSALCEAAAAIARDHKNTVLDVPVHHGVAQIMLDELTQDESPGRSRALPLDMECYLAIRKTAHEPRTGKGGRLERGASARNRGAVDIAMIGLIGNTRLRVSEAAALIWGDVRRLRGAQAGCVSAGQAGQGCLAAFSVKPIPKTISHI